MAILVVDDERAVRDPGGMLRLLPKPFHAANLLGVVSEALAEDRSGEVQ